MEIMTKRPRGACAKIGIAVAFVFVLIVVAGVSAETISYRNAEIDLRNQIEAKQQECELIFDQVWKTISQQGQVTADYRDSFRNIFVDIMDARHKEGSGQLMNWIQEANPNFDPTLHAKLMNSIEEQRMVFTREQRELISLAREHKTMLQRFPSSLFLSGRSPVDITLVTSTRTKESFRTGTDDNVEVFQK